MQSLIITLDGPAGSGKSTVARLLARRLGVEFLDTGAMYRGITAIAVDRGLNPADDAMAVMDLARHLRVGFDWKHDPPRLLVNGRDVTERLRDPDVTGKVSHVAAMSAVRQVLVESQRQIGQEHPRLVTEGRDQGSVVFPNANVKFYLDASPQVRARRRAEQLRAAGRTANESEILEQLIDRDHRDSSRQDGPLICPEDAVRIDTSNMTLDDVVERLEREVRSRAPGAAVKE